MSQWCLIERTFVQVIQLSFREYVKDPWNKMDIVIVFTSDLEMILSVAMGDKVGFLKLFRVLRTLRPLKLAKKHLKGLPVLVRTATKSAKALANTMVLVMAFGLLLGLFMMQLMSGMMNSCSDASVWTRTLCTGVDEDGAPREWKRYYINFDNLGQALFAQLILATQDDWPAHMLIGTDISGKHTGPSSNISLYIALFYMISVVAMAFVVINMVVGVFVEAYFGAKAELLEDCEDNPPLTEKDLPKLFQDPAIGSFRSKLLLIVTSKDFDRLIAVFICCNIVAMCFESYKRNTWQREFDLVSNSFFALVFGAECIAKIVAMRTRRYLDDNFNKFDFFLVMVTFFSFLSDSLSGFVSGDILRMLRMLRMLRILRAMRLIRSFKGLQMILHTLIRSFSHCSSLLAMLLLIFFMFSVVLVNWFGSMCVDGDQARPGLLGVTCLFTPEDRLLDRHAHFQGVGIAIYTLFRIATGDAWGEVMEATTLEPPTVGTWGFGTRSREPVSDAAWDMYQTLLSPPDSVRQAEVRAVDIAVESLRKWYSIVKGREEEDGWPMHDEVVASYVKLARLALPNCLTDGEAAYLQEKGVADCAVPGDYISSGPLQCAGTCGFTPIVTYLAFYLFFAVSAFVLFQLVIGVLMEIYLEVQDEALKTPTCPGCGDLTVNVMKRITRRWILNAHAKAAIRAGGGHSDDPAVHLRTKSVARMRSNNRVAPTENIERQGEE
jgi:uncharacterized protein YneF (UPF0154 family)